MGFLGSIAKSKTKKRQEAKARGIYTFRDKQLAKAKKAGKVTESQTKALKAVAKKKTPKKATLAETLVNRRDKINKLNKGY